MTPVTVITGFLGSGKTTLIARMLRDPGLRDTVVIVNDFGEVGLDHILVERIDGDVILLPAGCLCCTADGSLASTLERLDARRVSGEIPQFHRAIVETSGLADPVPVMQTILDRSVLLRGFTPGLVVTTVDAVSGVSTLNRFAEAERQVVVADRLLLTKTDLADTAALRDRLQTLNPRAAVYDVRHGCITADELIGPGLSDAAMFRTCSARGIASESFQHTRGVTSATVYFSEALNFTALSNWLEPLVSAHGRNIPRIKGIVRIRGQERPIAVHGAQHVFHPPKLLPQWPAEMQHSTIVFVLDGLNATTVFESAVSAGLPVLADPVGER